MRGRWLLVAYGVLLGMLVCGISHADIAPDPKPITWKDCTAGGASTVTVGGTAQNALASTPSLRGFFLQNPTTATENLMFDAAKAASLTASPQLAAGASVTYGPGTIFVGALSVNAATGGHAYLCQYAQ